MVVLPGAQAGGIAGLVAYLREHGEAVEADLQRFYGVRLSDLTTGRLTWRRLRVLLSQLPRDSSVARAELGEQAEWGLSEHLQASIFDAVNAANWQRSGKGRPPKPLPRPGLKKQGRTLAPSVLDPEKTRAFLDQFKPPRGGEGASGGD